MLQFELLGNLIMSLITHQISHFSEEIHRVFRKDSATRNFTYLAKCPLENMYDKAGKDTGMSSGEMGEKFLINFVIVKFDFCHTQYCIHNKQ